MKTLLLGAMGQLGRELMGRLPGEVIACTRKEIDISNAVALESLIQSIAPAIVVNAAAYNLVDKAEAEPEIAYRDNALAVRTIASACSKLHAICVQYSTDYVFGSDHTRTRPYLEADLPGPLSAYGMSKLAGEYFALSACTRTYVIRTCGLYGRHGVGGKGGNFVETMLRIAGQQKPLRVVADQCCCPTSCEDLANATVQLLESSSYGIYHLVNSGGCSWHEFAKAIFDEERIAANLTPIPSSEYSQAAKRPSFSKLSTEKAVNAGVTSMQPWRDALRNYLFARRMRRI